MKNIHISFAVENDLELLGSLLAECGLPYKHIADPNLEFIIAKDKTRFVGSIGLRKLDCIALIRSLSVKKQCRGMGIAKELYQVLSDYAIKNNIKKLYLLTTTAEEYFKKLGFKKIKKSNIPKSITNSIEYRKVCPKTSVCMCISLQKKEIK